MLDIFRCRSSFVIEKTSTSVDKSLLLVSTLRLTSDLYLATAVGLSWNKQAVRETKAFLSKPSLKSSESCLFLSTVFYRVIVVA